MKNFLWATIVLSLAFGCKKKDQEGVPYVQVDLYLYTSNPQFNNLNAVGGYTYINGGSRGILIYRKSVDEFAAYDRHCPYKTEDPCGRVSVDQTLVSAVDTCCGSSFLLYDGSVTNGPAHFPLKAYQTTFDGNVLKIFN